MTRYAIVDLEATDAKQSGQKIKIIQVGIVLLENGRKVGQFAADINPHEKLSMKIRQLTGLTDARLQKAPDFSILAKMIMHKLKDSVFVAHNVQFDYGLLSESLLACGYRLHLPCVDTVELARVVYPSFGRYGLDALDEELGLRNAHPHTALSDALATSVLLQKMQEKLRRLPRAVVAELVQHAGNLIADSHLVIDECLDSCPDQVAGLKCVGNIVTRVFANDPMKALATSETSGAFPPDSLREFPLSSSSKNNTRVLAEDFTENMTALGLKARKLQKQLSAIVSDDLKNNVPSFIEAPTGAGKTYAYLLPSLADGRKVIVSTPTKVLQEQLMTDVVPQLVHIFGLTAVKLVGTQNYISLDRLQKALQSLTDGKNTEIFKMKCLVWLTETMTGELSELSGIMTSREMLSRVAHTGFVGKGSLHEEQDFWLRAKNLSEKANLVVINHAYLTERITDDKSFFRKRVLIVDEAQQLFTVLEQARQKSFAVIEALLELPMSTKTPARKHLAEALIHQLGQKELDVKKIEEQAQKLGLSALTEFLSSQMPQNIRRDKTEASDLAMIDKIFWMDGNRLKSSPKDFYNFQKLLPHGVKTFFIGAGLAFTPGNPRLPELLGFDLYNFYSLPEKITNHQRLFIATDGLPVQNVSVQDYGQYVADCLSALTALKKPLIVLFTSQLMLDWTARALEKTTVSFAAQDAHHRPEQVKKTFDDKKVQVLLGTGSFWEGVDFDKPTRSILVIARLPFATPDDVLTKKFAAQFANPFYDFNVPMATLKLRQAIGRVNRRPQQKSAVLVLDGRLAGSSYGKSIRANLSRFVAIKSDSFATLLEATKDFLAK